MGWRNYLFGFRGRINRGGFWLYLAIAVLLCAVLLMGFWAYALSVPGAYENGGPTPFPTDPAGIAAASAFFALLALIVICLFAVSVKRLHDRGKAWWWVLIFLVLPHPVSGLGNYLSQSGGSPAAIITLWLAAAALLIWGFAELALLPGMVGENRFGPDPRGRQPGKASD